MLKWAAIMLAFVLASAPPVQARRSGQPSSFANANIRARAIDRSMNTRMLCNV